MNYESTPRAEIFLEEAKAAMLEARAAFEKARIRLSECEELVRALSLLSEQRRAKPQKE